MNELNSPTVLALLASYPTPAALRQASIEAVTTVLRAASHGHFSHELANRLVEAATQTVGVPGRQDALQLKVCVLTERIQALNQAIDVVESQIGELFRCLGVDTDAFPVGGATSLATLVAEIEDIGRFPSIKQFLSALRLVSQDLPDRRVPEPTPQGLLIRRVPTFRSGSPATIAPIA